MSFQYRSKPLFRHDETTPSTSSTLTSDAAPVMARQQSDAAASSSMASSRLPPRRFSQRGSIASSAIIAPVAAAGAPSRHGTIITATTPLNQDRDDANETGGICSGQSSRLADGSINQRRARAAPGPAAAGSSTSVPSKPTEAVNATAEIKSESLGKPAMSVSAGTGDWVDSIGDDEVVFVEADAEPHDSAAAAHSDKTSVEHSETSAGKLEEATRPVLYGTVEGRARRASSCSQPSTLTKASTTPAAQASPPPRPVARGAGGGGGGGGLAAPLSVTALTGGRSTAASRQVNVADKNPAAAFRSTPRSTSSSRAHNPNQARRTTSTRPRESVDAHSRSSTFKPFELRTSSPQRGSVARHQSELLRMELEKPVHRVPAGEMSRLMALPRANDSALPVGLTRLDLAQEEDVKELFRHQYLVDPLMRRRPGKRQFYVPPQADIFGMYGIRDLPLDGEEQAARAVADEAGSVAARSGRITEADSRSASERASQPPSQRPASERPSTRGAENSSDLAQNHSMPACASASQRSAPVSQTSKNKAPIPEPEQPPQPRSTSRQELLERCAQRRMQREQRQAQPSQPQPQPQPQRQEASAPRPQAAALSHVSGFSGFAVASSVHDETSRPACVRTITEVSPRATATSSRTGFSQRPAEGDGAYNDKGRESDAYTPEPDAPSRVRDAAASSSAYRSSQRGVRVPPVHERQPQERRDRSHGSAVPPTPTRATAVATAVVAEDRYASVEPQYMLNESASMTADGVEDVRSSRYAEEDEEGRTSLRQPPCPTQGRRGRPSTQPTAEKTNLDLSWQPTAEADVSHNVDSGADYHPSVRQRDAIARQYAAQPDNVHQRTRPDSHRFTSEMAAQGAHGDHDIFGVSARVGQLAMDAAMRQYSEKMQPSRSQHTDPSAASGDSSQHASRLDEPRPHSNRVQCVSGADNSPNNSHNKGPHARRVSSEVGEEAVMRSLNDGRRPFMTGEVESPSRDDDENGSDGSDGALDAPVGDSISDAEYDLDTYMYDRIGGVDGVASLSHSIHNKSRQRSAPVGSVDVPAPLPEAPSHYLPYSAAPYAPVRRSTSRKKQTAANNKNNTDNTSVSTAAKAPSWASVGDVSPIPRASAIDPPTQVSSRGDETSFLIRRAPRDASPAHTCQHCGHDVVVDAGPPVVMVVAGQGEVEVLATSDGVPSRQVSPEATVTHRTSRQVRSGVQRSSSARRPVEEPGPAYMCKPRDHDIFLRRPPTKADAPVPTGRRSFSAGVSKSRRVSQAYDSSQVSSVLRWQ